MNYYPEHQAELKAAIFAWVKSASAIDVTVAWAKQRTADGDGVPMPPKPCTIIDLLVPPVTEGHAEHRNERVVQVLNAVADTRYVVQIDGLDYGYVSTGTPTLSEIRDGLIAEINDADVGFSAGAITEDALLIAAAYGEHDPAIIPDDDELLVLRIAQCALVDGLATFSISTYADDDSAPARAKRIELSLDNETTLHTLNLGGWASSRILNVRKPDDVVNGAWEQRGGFDALLRCRMRSIEIVDFIEYAAVGPILATDDVISGTVGG